jgi:hypothetical protein
VPELRALESGHVVACHWAEKIKAGEIKPQEREAQMGAAPTIHEWEPPPV